MSKFAVTWERSDGAGIVVELYTRHVNIDHALESVKMLLELSCIDRVTIIRESAPIEASESK